MEPLQTPLIHSFLHLLPSTVGLWAVLDVGELSSANLKASTVSICLAGTQVCAVPSLWCFLVHAAAHSVWEDLKACQRAGMVVHASTDEFMCGPVFQTHMVVQVASMFGALVHSSVYMVIPWYSLVPQLISFEREFLYESSSISVPRTLLLAFGVSGVAVALVSGLRPPLDALFFVLLWATATAFRAAWDNAKQHADGFSLTPGQLQLARLQELYSVDV